MLPSQKQNKKKKKKKKKKISYLPLHDFAAAALPGEPSPHAACPSWRAADSSPRASASVLLFPPRRARLCPPAPPHAPPPCRSFASHQRFLPSLPPARPLAPSGLLPKQLRRKKEKTKKKKKKKHKHKQTQSIPSLLLLPFIELLHYEPK
jgi:hypothetical protein